MKARASAGKVILYTVLVIATIGGVVIGCMAVCVGTVVVAPGIGDALEHAAELERQAELDKQAAETPE